MELIIILQLLLISTTENGWETVWEYLMIWISYDLESSALIIEPLTVPRSSKLSLWARDCRFIIQGVIVQL